MKSTATFSMSKYKIKKLLPSAVFYSIIKFQDHIRAIRNLKSAVYSVCRFPCSLLVYRLLEDIEERLYGECLAEFNARNKSHFKFIRTFYNFEIF